MDVTALSFNSIKVQLELKAQKISESGLMFQFHKGAIRTDVTVDQFAELFSFNSIKVQLEPITTRIVTSSFTMGFGDLLVKDLSLKNVDI